MLLTFLGLHFESQFPGRVLRYMLGSGNSNLWFRGEAGRDCLGASVTIALAMQMLLFIPKAMWWLTLVLNLIDLRPIRDMTLGSVRAYFLEVLPEQGSPPPPPKIRSHLPGAV